MITSTHHSGFVVKDLTRAVKFYRDVLGLKIYDSFDLDGEELSRGIGYENAHIKRLPCCGRGRGHILELLEYINPPFIDRPDGGQKRVGSRPFRIHRGRLRGHLPDAHQRRRQGVKPAGRAAPRRENLLPAGHRGELDRDRGDQRYPDTHKRPRVLGML